MNPTLPQLDPTALLVIAVLAIWSLVIKGFALYRAGANQQKGWFTALFILNTVGILELIYILVIDKKKK